MRMADYYATLEVQKDASQSEIKRAYRRLASKYHPDKSDGNADKFKEISEAYQILSDENKRAQYDRFGSVDPQMGGGPGGMDINDIFGGVFNDFFGGGGGQRQAKGMDVEFQTAITLEDAVFGKDIQVDIPATKVCPKCNGTGTLQVSHGFIAMQQTCPMCRGSGRVNDRKSSGKKINVKIPAGIDHGDRIRVEGGGYPGEGVPPGDLYVIVEIKKHALFDRERHHLHCQVPIDIVTAALGGQIEVPTLTGKVNLKIASGTQTGTQLRLRGRGMPSLRSGGTMGDLMCTVFVETPVKLNAAQTEMLKSFGESIDVSHQPKQNEWMKNIKAFFKMA
ncbi:MAG: molecular chaperone DnaJ [Gammaproteobacteria bacterium]|nr:molecular chaperone DnaJ [Gammaproteobacteria bacterium]